MLLQTILAHGPIWSEWHHLLPYLPVAAGVGIAGAMGWLSGFWTNRIALGLAAIGFLAFGLAIDGISEAGHHIGFLGAGLFVGRLVSLKG